MYFFFLALCGLIHTRNKGLGDDAKIKAYVLDTIKGYNRVKSTKYETCAIAQVSYFVYFTHV